MKTKTIIVFYRTKDHHDSEWENTCWWQAYNPERETAARIMSELRLGFRQSFSDHEFLNVVIG
jgi:hypothetical protein